MAATCSPVAYKASEITCGRPSRDEVQRWGMMLEGQDPDTIIRFALEHFGEGLAVATQFGVEGCALLHRVSQLDKDAYFFTIDTGLLFDETYKLASKIERRLNIKIDRVRSDHSIGMQAVTYGANLWETDPDLCCTVRKVMPMQEVLEKRSAWMTSVRRGQTETRSKMSVVQWDERFGLAKFAPLAAESFEAIKAYVKEHRVPTNPLRLVGYQSVGCVPCTRPIADGEDQRAGRWTGTSKTECGLHTVE